MADDKKMSRKGFSLVELLVTILIIAIVLGIGGFVVTNIINNSSDKGYELALSSVEKAGSMYVREYSNEVIWEQDTSILEGEIIEDVASFGCVSVSELINKQFLKEEELDERFLDKYVLVFKNESGSIIRESLDESGTCSNLYGNNEKVIVPTSKNFCIDRVYNGEEQKIVNDLEGTIIEKSSFKEAGEYSIKFKLENGKIWRDGTVEDKKIICSIKKATPNFSFVNLDSNAGVVLGTKDIIVKSNVLGDITLKSSNVNYVTASIDNSVIEKDVEKKITIQTLSNRAVDSYVDITLTPKDTKNYESVVITYRIGKIDVTKVERPSASNVCNKLTYNKGVQTLTKEISTENKKAYYYVDNVATNAGSYTVVAKLNYGYTWSDGSTSDHEFQCSIAKATPSLVVSEKKTDDNVMNGKNNEVMRTYAKELGVKASEPGKLIVTSSNTDEVSVEEPSSNGATIGANVEGLVKLRGNKVSSNVDITIKLVPDDSNNYNETSKIYKLKVISDQYTATYVTEGGTACSPSSKLVTYNQKYDNLCSTTKIGYIFKNWFRGNSEVTKDTILNLIGDHNLTARWDPITYTVTLNNQSATTAGTTAYYYQYNTTKTVNGVEVYYYSDSALTTPLTNGTTITVPTRTGYTFGGYYTETNGGGKQYVNESGLTVNNRYQVAGNVTLYAKWTANTYTVTLNNQSATTAGTTAYYYQYNTTKTVNGVEVYYYSDSALTTPLTNGTTITVPTRTGYTFGGYYTETNGGGKQYVNESGLTVNNRYQVAENVTLYAKWTVNNYYVDLNWTLDGSNFSPIDNTHACAYVEIGGTSKGCVTDYYTQHPHGTTYKITKIKLNGTDISYSYSGTINGNNLSHAISLNTLIINRNNDSYGTVSSPSLYVKNGATFTTSSNVLSINDGRKVTATASGATGYTISFSSWSPESGTITSATTITAIFSRKRNFVCATEGQVTTYAGKQWDTLGNDGKNCILAGRFVTSVAGSYDNRVGGVEKYLKEIANAELTAGLIKNYDNRSDYSNNAVKNIDVTGKAFWITSEEVYVKGITMYKLKNPIVQETIYAGAIYQSTSKLNSEKIYVDSSYETYTEGGFGGVPNSYSSIDLATSIVNDQHYSTYSKYYTTLTTITRGVKDNLTGNGEETYENGKNGLNIHRNVSSGTDLDSHAYIHRLFACGDGPHESYKHGAKIFALQAYSSTQYYLHRTASNLEKILKTIGDGTNYKFASRAGDPDNIWDVGEDGTKKLTKEYHFDSGGKVCGIYSRKLGNTPYDIFYVPSITVDISE